MPGMGLWEHLHKARITHATLPPSALALLPRQSLPHLQSLIVAGEPCPPALAEYWSAQQRFFNAYGPTENTVCASIAPCTPADIAQDAPLSIGKPIPNTQLYILDVHRQPAPIGVAGELYIGGTSLARGYLHRPELTAERFIANPFSSIPGDRLYKTGDLASFRADGTIDFLGRIDHQVKIRGFRIEPGEIEAALTSHPEVRESVVIASPQPSAGGSPQEQHLVAYAAVDLPGQEQELTAKLRMFLKQTLPDYMIPSAFVLLESLPLTPNGKIDRKALPDPDGHAEQSRYQPPRDFIEQQLVELWESVFNTQPVGVHDDFFALGGHSLLAARLVNSMNTCFEAKLTISTLFAHPTIARTALLLRKAS